MKKEKPTKDELQQHILQLERELEKERMLVICLDKLIDVAERELNISIRKKSGAKQSKK